ncbi:MAG: hypothetical protein A3J67_06695 [Parcubacteria group bacterium RIFCSPHIGHO2_02_FULL_48_10b]|nr:MAG: hypothetical protein A3J67_06695 [Parcubacteria group bacterium RIFCSPHIGHO2_02_FULL_48_10b]
MIRLYSIFLKKVLNIPLEKIKIGLILYPDLSDEQCKRFWKEIVRLPENNFMKTQYIRSRHPTKRLSWGICMVVVNNLEQKVKMLTWIDLFSRKFTIDGKAGVV